MNPSCIVQDSYSVLKKYYKIFYLGYFVFPALAMTIRAIEIRDAAREDTGRNGHLICIAVSSAIRNPE